MAHRAAHVAPLSCGTTPSRRIAAVAVAIGVAAVTFAVPAAAAERAIDKSVEVAAGVDAIWAVWTTREGIVGFMAPDAVVDARVGGAFQPHFDPLAAPGSKGADDMRFMALQPKRMLSFDWNAPPSLPEVRRQRTFVIVRLEPLDASHTRVTLHHTGWGDGGQWDQTYAYFDRAWATVLANLKKRFETGPIDWAPWLAQLRQWHAKEAAAASAPK